MAENWGQIAAEVADALRSVGSTDAGYPGAIRRVEVSGGDPFDPGSGTETVTYHDCTLVVTDYSLREREASSIGAGDKKVLIGADVAVEPTNNDRLVIGMTAAEAAGQLGREIVRVMPVAPAGVAVMFSCQVRL